MKNCKRIFLAVVLSLSVLSIAKEASAAARSNEAFDYLSKDPSLSRLTAGVYAGTVDRRISLKGSRLETVISSTRTYGYLGLDLANWVNVYGILGANEAELTGSSTTDSENIIGGGLSFNLLNRFVREPLPLEDAIRINGDIRILSTEAAFFPNTISWQEITASLRLSLINFPYGNKAYRPEAIALYAGPSLSIIQSSDVEATQEFGVMGGIEIFFFDSFSVDVNVERYEETSVSAGLNFRF
jgi:hypothetical protein